MKAREVIEAINAEASGKAFRENKWGERQAQAFEWPRGPERGVVGLIRALADYADWHAERFESPIGDDGVLGVEWTNACRATLGLLNGELGRLDGGTLDEMIREMAKSQGVDGNEL